MATNYVRVGDDGGVSGIFPSRANSQPWTAQELAMATFDTRLYRRDTLLVAMIASAADTQVTVFATSIGKYAPGQTITIDGETMTVTGVDVPGNRVTVTRGANPIAHAVGAKVSHRYAISATAVTWNPALSRLDFTTEAAFTGIAQMLSIQIQVDTGTEVSTAVTDTQGWPMVLAVQPRGDNP